MKISKENTEHYIWGSICDGWHLVKTDELSIIHEKMPPGTSEVKHFHQIAKQFFFVLSGQAVMEVNGEINILNQHEGIEILPKIPHKMMNQSDSDVEFLVVSSPTSKGDRIPVQ